MTTGERLKLRRKELGLSAEYVAAQLNCSASTVYRYEKGDIEKVPVDILRPLAQILHTTSAYLLGLSDESDIVNAPDSSDAELSEYLELLRSRPECRMLFSLAKGATKEDVEKAVAIIEALRKTEGKA